MGLGSVFYRVKRFFPPLAGSNRALLPQVTVRNVFRLIVYPPGRFQKHFYHLIHVAFCALELAKQAHHGITDRIYGRHERFPRVALAPDKPANRIVRRGRLRNQESQHIHGKIAVLVHGVKNRRMSAEAVAVRLRRCVHVCSVRHQYPRTGEVIELGTNVQQRNPFQRGESAGQPVLPGDKARVFGNLLFEQGGIVEQYGQQGVVPVFQSVVDEGLYAVPEPRRSGVLARQFLEERFIVVALIGTDPVLKTGPYSFDGMQFDIDDQFLQVVHNRQLSLTGLAGRVRQPGIVDPYRRDEKDGSGRSGNFPVCSQVVFRIQKIQPGDDEEEGGNGEEQFQGLFVRAVHKIDLCMKEEKTATKHGRDRHDFPAGLFHKYTPFTHNTGGNFDGPCSGIEECTDAGDEHVLCLTVQAARNWRGHRIVFDTNARSG